MAIRRSRPPPPPPHQWRQWLLFRQTSISVLSKRSSKERDENNNNNNGEPLRTRDLNCVASIANSFEPGRAGLSLMRSQSQVPAAFQTSTRSIPPVSPSPMGDGRRRIIRGRSVLISATGGRGQPLTAVIERQPRSSVFEGLACTVRPSVGPPLLPPPEFPSIGPTAPTRPPLPPNFFCRLRCFSCVYPFAISM